MEGGDLLGRWVRAGYLGPRLPLRLLGSGTFLLRAGGTAAAAAGAGGCAGKIRTPGVCVGAGVQGLDPPVQGARDGGGPG